MITEKVFVDGLLVMDVEIFIFLNIYQHNLFIVKQIYFSLHFEVKSI